MVRLSRLARLGAPMSPNEILALAIRRGRRSTIPIKQIQKPVSVPVKVVEKPPRWKIRVAKPLPASEPPLPQFPTVGEIMRVVAQHYLLSIVDMVSVRRNPRLCLPRQIAMYLGRTLTPRSLPEIGRLLGGRDHTTIMHGYRKISALLETDADLRANIEQIKRKLGSDGPPAESSAPAAPPTVAGATLSGDA